jgi:hypothetical protein
MESKLMGLRSRSFKFFTALLLSVTLAFSVSSPFTIKLQAGVTVPSHEYELVQETGTQIINVPVRNNTGSVITINSWSLGNIPGNKTLTHGSEAALMLTVNTTTLGLQEIKVIIDYTKFTALGSPGVNENEEITVYVRVVTPTAPPTVPPPAETPRIAMISPTAVINAAAGVPGVMNVTVQNTGKATVNNLRFFTNTNFTYSATISNSVAATLAPDGNHVMALNYTFDGGLPNNAQEMIRLFYTGYTNNGDLVEGSFDVLFRISAVTTPSPAPAGSPDIRLTSPVNYVNVRAGEPTAVNITLTNVGSAAPEFRIYTLPTMGYTFHIQAAPASNLASNASRAFTVNVTPDRDIGKSLDEVKVFYTYVDRNGITQDGSVSIPIRIENPVSAGSPDVRLTAPVNFVGLKAGEQTTVSLTLTNVGAAASDFRVYTQPTIGYTFNMPLTPVSSFAAGTSRAYTVNITPDRDITKETDSVKIYYSYVDRNGVTLDGSVEIPVRIDRLGVEDTSGATLRFSDVTRPTATFQVGREFEVSFKLTNHGDRAAENIRITSAGATGLIPRSAAVIFEASIAPGETKTYTFKYSALETALSQNYGINIAVEYRASADVGVALRTANEYIGINIHNPATNNTPTANVSQPRIMIKNYTITPQIVQAGEEFDIYLVFENTHSEKTVKNITATLNLTATSANDNVFTPVGSSNSFFFDDIAPKGFVEQNIRMFTLPGAEARNYTIEVVFQYEDENGTPFSARENFGISVKQVTRLEVGGFNIPNLHFEQFQPAWLSFSVHNTGRTQMRNLKVWFESDEMDTSMSEEIFGHFNAGNYREYDAMVIPFVGGMATLRMVITYDNDVGERVEETEEFLVFVSEAWNMDHHGRPEWPPNGFYPPEDEDGSLWKTVLDFIKDRWIWIVAGAGALVFIAAAAVISVVVIRKRRSDGELDFDE